MTIHVIRQDNNSASVLLSELADVQFHVGGCGEGEPRIMYSTKGGLGRAVVFDEARHAKDAYTALKNAWQEYLNV